MIRLDFELKGTVSPLPLQVDIVLTISVKVEV